MGRQFILLVEGFVLPVWQYGYRRCGGLLKGEVGVVARGTVREAEPVVVLRHNRHVRVFRPQQAVGVFKSVDGLEEQLLVVARGVGRPLQQVVVVGGSHVERHGVVAGIYKDVDAFGRARLAHGPLLARCFLVDFLLEDAGVACTVVAVRHHKPRGVAFDIIDFPFVRPGPRGQHGAQCEAERDDALPRAGSGEVILRHRR